VNSMKNIKLNIKAITIGILMYLIAIFIAPLLFALLVIGIDNIFDFEKQTLKIFDMVIEELVWLGSVIIAGYTTASNTKQTKLKDVFSTGLIIFLYNLIGTIQGMVNFTDTRTLYDLFSELLIVPFCIIGALIKDKSILRNVLDKSE
jgi:hypothetical protein